MGSPSLEDRPVMPQISCARCSRVLEYSGDRPSFCGYCGQSLETVTGSETVVVTSAPALVAGRGDQTIDFVPGAGAIAKDPDLVKGYRLIRQLGRGGMGTVFEAEDSRFGRKVALKIIAPGYVESPDAVRRFRQEGRLASSLAHPRCVFVLEADEDADGRPFIAMELMTGDTLQDLVEKNGPLPVGEAVAKILDVIEGLTEAHRLGLIHRDVKPSNCFLDAEGRVKVGDFGLSKSQVGSAHLTRTGSFLGTPLYASPEQIKVEPLDGRTDVYSTAATLFYLLTGRAPFDRGDASATMARIVSDPAPSAREKRPEVPPGLDRAIRKGLERDLDRRHADLNQLRGALLPFLPGQAPPARIVQRVGAYLFDTVVINVPLAIFLNFMPMTPAANLATNFLIVLGYFAIGDGIWGGTPGKRLLGMRVVDVGGREPAGLGRSTLRALIFLGLADMPSEMMHLDDDWNTLLAVGCLLGTALGVAVLASPIWLRRGRDPLHDLAARTRVIVLPRDHRRRSAGARRVIGRDRGSVTRPIGVLQSVGPYKVRGAVRWEPDRRVVTGEDSSLGREAWIVIRHRGSPAPEPARREVSRATRPRWLAGGEQNEGRWDAYVAPAGCPLADLAGAEGLPWHDARPILEDLADELTAACADGTLPPGLTVDQVWVQPDGRAILVDPLAIAHPSAESEALANGRARALTLLRKAAAPGGSRGGGVGGSTRSPRAIQSPVPIHASATLGRLLGGADAHATVAAFRADLESSRHQPTEVGPGQRATQVGILAGLLTVGLGITYFSAYSFLIGDFDEDPAEGGDPSLTRLKVLYGIFFVTLFPVVLVAWDFVTRGGFSLKLAGLGLVRWDGRKAPRWRCAWRSFLVWLPMVGLLVASVTIQAYYPKPSWPHWVPFCVALGLLPCYALLAMIFRSCGPHDYLSGLRVVPR